MKAGGRPRLAAIPVAATMLALSVPAVASADSISVTTRVDDFVAIGVGAGCSVREAVETANTDLDFGGCTQTGGSSDADTITLDAPSAGTPYLLSRDDDMTNDDNNDGDLDVTETLTIEGDGTGASPLQGNGFTFDDERLIHVLTGDLTVRDMAITKGNVGGLGGAGIVSVPAGNTVTVERVLFDDNDATAPGGAIAKGGGGTLNITDSTFVLNSTSGIAGGAIDTNAAVTITGSTFEDNTASANGARGAAISLFGPVAATLSLTNSTLSDNDSDAGGAILLDSAGAGAGAASITHTTIANSTAVDAGVGGAIVDASPAGDVTLRATILNANTAAGVPSNCSSTAGMFTSAGRNLSDTAAGQCGLVATGPMFDLVNTSAGLGPLAGNSGPTRTHAIAFPSPAVDHVPAAECLTITVDQRGVGRPIGPGCDVGAYEAPLPSPATVTPPSTPPTTPATPSAPKKKKKCKRKRKKGSAAAAKKCKKKKKKKKKKKRARR